MTEPKIELNVELALQLGLLRVLCPKHDVPLERPSSYTDFLVCTHWSEKFRERCDFTWYPSNVVLP